MIYALLGDVHSNLPALQAVVKEIKKISPDAVYFLGDAVGYGPWPKETLEILKEIVSEGVLGNHDAGVVGKTDISDYYDAVRYVINWTTDILENDQYEFLDKLKYIHVEPEPKDFLLSHGSPRMPERYDYVFGNKSVNRLYEVEPYLKQMNFVGHSHYMNLFIMTEHERAVEIDISAGEIEVDYDRPVVCVCGSVGQPRDGDPRAGFVTYDTDKKKIKFHRVDYDVEKTVKKIIDLKLPRSFGERLRDGY